MENKKYDFTTLEGHLLNEINTNRISGVSVSVYKDGELLYDKCFGYANIEKGYKITPITRFRLASMTKPITAVAAMIAQEQGLLNIDDYAYKYLPIIKDRKMQDVNLNIVDEGPYNFTIRQLLCHNAGFACNAYEGSCHKAYCKDEHMHELKDFIEDTKDMGVLFVPGTKMGYSGSFAYNLVARIIEITSGMKYIDFLTKYLFEPLGMTSTSYVFNKGEEKDKAISYKSIDNKLEYVDDEDRGFELYYPGFNSGGAGLISTKSDYLKFGIMLLNKGIYNGHRVLTEESVKELVHYTPTPNMDSGGIETFGLSFFIRAPKYSDWQKLPSGSFGWSGAYGTHFWVDPVDNMVVIYMHNSVTFGGSGSPQHYQIEDDIVNMFGIKR